MSFTRGDDEFDTIGHRAANYFELFIFSGAIEQRVYRFAVND